MALNFYLNDTRLGPGSEIGGPGTAAGAIVALEPGSWVLDTTTTPPTLRLVPQTREVFEADGSGPNFALAASPLVGSERVFYDGVLLAPTTDYTLVGNILTLAEVPLAGVVIQVLYL